MALQTVTVLVSTESEREHVVVEHEIKVMRHLGEAQE